LEAHVDAVKPGEKVAVVDDLLATGGTAWGAAELVSKQKGEVGAFLFVVELTFLKGRERLAGTGAPGEALISVLASPGPSTARHDAAKLPFSFLGAHSSGG